MKFGYARVSTSRQDHALQIDALEAQSIDDLVQEAESGGKRDRPELNRMLDRLRPGDEVIVYKLDRLARSLSDLLHIVDRIEQAGAALKVLDQDLDTSTAGGKLIFHVFGAISEFERSLLRERTKAGLDAARKRGKIGGRPSKLTEADKKQINALMAAPDRNVREICRRFGISKATLYRHSGDQTAA